MLPTTPMSEESMQRMAAFIPTLALIAMQQAPAPELSLDHGGLWVTFHFPPAVVGAPEEALGETTQNTTQNTTQKILAILRAQPQASRKDIAAQIGDLTEDGVKYQLAKLKAKGWIRRVGPDRGGRWEVLV